MDIITYTIRVIWLNITMSRISLLSAKAKDIFVIIQGQSKAKAEV